MTLAEPHSDDASMDGTTGYSIDGLPAAEELPAPVGSGAEYLERLLLDHSDRMTWIGREGEVATFGILHLEHDEAGTRFEVRLSRDSDMVRAYVVNRETTEGWPIGSGDTIRIDQIREARIVDDELTALRAERLRGLLRR